MASSRTTLHGLDINRSNICYTRCYPADKLIDSIGIQPLEMGVKDYWQSVSNGFDDFFKQYKIPGENVISSLPGEYAIIKKIALERDETEIEEVIEWELSQQIVGSIDDFVFDYQLITQDKTAEYQSYLVVGYRNIAVSRISKLLRLKKLNPLIIDVDIFALINAFELNYDEMLMQPVLLIFSDIYRTQLVLTMQGMFVDIDVVNHTEEMMTPEGLVAGLKPAIRSLCAHNPPFSSQNAVHSYITGPFFSQQEMSQGVIAQLPNTEILYPFRKIQCNAGMDEETLHEFAPLLAVSVGLALRDVE